MELRSDCIGQKWEGHVKTLLYLIYCTFYNKILSYKKTTNLLLQNSVSLAKKNFKANKKNKSFVRLPEEVKVARYHGKVASDDWKQLNFPLEGDAHNIYHAKHKDYYSKLRDFLNHLEADKIENFCNAADCNEKLSWKLLKGQKSFSRMSAFLVNGNLLTDRNVIRDMWADHFEALGTPTENEYFDNAFLSRVVSGVREIFDSCTNNPFRVLCEPLRPGETSQHCFPNTIVCFCVISYGQSAHIAIRTRTIMFGW